MNHQIGILKFRPIFQYRIWGGKKLKNVLLKNYTEDLIGESWEISGVKGNETLVSEGIFEGETLQILIDKYSADLVGDKCFNENGKEFPILIKFIDTAAPLSVQVHPNNALAKERHSSLGKNEMWYIMDADVDSNLLIGFSKQMDKKSFKYHIEKGNLTSILNNINVKKGELYYLPAGRVHAIGKGVLLAEIQQTSDITYRVYDYDRVDKNTGKKRELHIEESVDAIDFDIVKNYRTAYDNIPNKQNLMIETPYFKTNYFCCSKELSLNYIKNESFKIFICTEGSGTLKITNQKVYITKGDTILLAANEEKLTISPEKNVELLEVSY